MYVVPIITLTSMLNVPIISRLNIFPIEKTLLYVGGVESL